ncbi:uncharacterized protein LOC110849522 [Folsomia candida]|uniref:uncharacterized protein LOC110849522 n=1 Tax=Folsomia candida TaxID=158441 RepID=UPI000B901B76|nr:uncharacterized protein LOC110849522 [Folsomia candida]
MFSSLLKVAFALSLVVSIQSNLDAEWHSEYAAYKCHKGYVGKPAGSTEAALKTCSGKDITAYPCFVACVGTEEGIYKAGEEHESEREKDLKALFDDTAESKATITKWVTEAEKCTEKFPAGKKIPTDFKGDCADFAQMRKCITDGRKC